MTRPNSAAPSIRAAKMIPDANPGSQEAQVVLGRLGGQLLKRAERGNQHDALLYSLGFEWYCLNQCA